MSRSGGDGLETRQAPALEASSPVPLTTKQAAVLSEITRYHEATGDRCRASYLVRRLELSRSGVQAHVDALWRKGWLRSPDSPFLLRGMRESRPRGRAERPMFRNEARGIGRKLRFDVLKRDRFACRYCGRKPPEVALHVDHLEPVTLGGADTIDNLVTACEDCNLGKGARPVESPANYGYKT
jgi:hypothetical protein